MPDQYVTLVVVCEDLQHRVFLYRFLIEKGVVPRRIQFQQCPKGRGDAIQWVKSKHVREVAQLRKRPHILRGVVTVADADNCTVKDRKSQFDTELESIGQKPRQPNEPIALVIPRRQIETWILHLRGVAVDENKKCKHFRGNESNCSAEVKRFAQKCPGGMNKDDLPSLQDGCSELSRLLQYPGKDRKG